MVLHVNTVALKKCWEGWGVQNISGVEVCWWLVPG